MAHRFYFDLTDGHSIIRDAVGAQADSLDQAIRDAQAVLGEVQDAKGSEWTIIIRDAAGEELMRLPVVEPALN